jgi:tetratricopeptide (TPR) repeat protein
MYTSKADKSGRLQAAAVAAAMFASLTCGGCAGGGKVSDLIDSGWDESRRDADTRIVTLLRLGGYDEVIDIADSIEAVEGSDPRLQGQKAEALWRTGSVDEAVALFEESLLADYAVCETHLNFAVLLLETGKTGRALTELNEARMFCGLENTPVINRNLAVVRIKRGEEDEALAVVEEGLEDAPNDSYLLGLKGMLIAESNPVLAETLFVMSERAGGMTPDFLYQLGLLMLRSSQPSRAVKPLKETLAADPSDLEVKYNYAEALARSGKTEEAESVLREMLDGDYGEKAAQRLARLIFRRGDYAEALALFRTLPETPENSDRVAMCLHRLSRTDEAIVIQRAVVDARPDWPTGMINLAVMLASVGELDESERLLTRALELDPENVTALVNLESLRKARSGTGR